MFDRFAITALTRFVQIISKSRHENAIFSKYLHLELIMFTSKEEFPC